MTDSIPLTTQIRDADEAHPDETWVAFEVSLEAFPYLADHGFQDLVVLPGSFLVWLALQVHLQTARTAAGRIQRVEFRTPVILSERNTKLSVGVRRLDGQRAQYALREEEEGRSGSPPATPCAVLEIAGEQLAEPEAGLAHDFIKEFQKRAEFLGDQASFYGCLRANGNQYGPRLQSVRKIWRFGTEALGRLHVAPEIRFEQTSPLNPIFLDGVTQLASALLLEQGRTYVLQGIEDIRVWKAALPDEVWVHAQLRSEGNATPGGWSGDLKVLDDSGACLVRLSGVRFTYLDRPELAQDGATARPRIVIASNFTAEPVAEPLSFWSDHLGFPVEIEFTPYNQVFQALLDPNSLLRGNQAGFNVILLNLEDWAVGRPSLELSREPRKAKARLGNLLRHTLPNGLEVAHLNRYETEYLYQEIFQDRCYLREGIHLREEATVVDIGANIGLFSLFVRSLCPRASVYAFEPNPVAFAALEANCDLYGPGLHPFHAGVSDRRGSASFTFYPGSSVFSGFHPNLEEDRQAIQAVVANLVEAELGNPTESVVHYVEELTADRLKAESFECPLLSVSDIIRENHLQRVDLLKVDAEKCELEILRGIEPQHWPLIDQVVVEVHDRTRRAVEEVRRILVERGFECAVEEEGRLIGSGLFNVYATRPDKHAPVEFATGPRKSAAVNLQATVDQFVQVLDGFTRAAGSPTVLCICPARPAHSRSPGFDQEILAVENALVNRVREFSNLHVISSDTLLAWYPADDFHDPHAHDLGHIPFTSEGFAALGSALFRTFVALRRPPYKVIVLDCDDTLWRGACGEEGPLGVKLTPAHAALQEFMIRQMDAGMLLCLCSKNNEMDVWAVFDQHPEMKLKRAHLAAWRINWSPKSANLQSLADELNLGVDAMIFVDDNPVECAEVRAHCREALVLQLPVEPGRWRTFLDHAWAFDHLRVTEDDRARTERIRENVQREQYRGQVSTLKDFITGLQLQVAVFEPAEDRLNRISQLTLRTNQFNFTTVRRSESELRRHLADGRNRCLAVQVQDRFGDYGLVGALLYAVKDDRFAVDTFLLSCRVLGRGVEHQVLAELGRRALEQGKAWVMIPFRPTPKNAPAWEFAQSVGAEFLRQVDGEAILQFPVARVAGLRYEPADLPLNPDRRPEPQRGKGVTSVMPGLSEKLPRIADRLHGVKPIVAAVEAHRLQATGDGQTAAAGELPATFTGRMLALWRKAIGNPQIGMDDKFVEVGGTSLKAVQVVAAIRREMHLQLPIVTLFECPTVRQLCRKLAPDETVDQPAKDAFRRGSRRRQRLERRLEARSITL